MHRKSCQDVTELSHTSQHENITDIIFWNKDVTECLILIRHFLSLADHSNCSFISCFEWYMGV